MARGKGVILIHTRLVARDLTTLAARFRSYDLDLQRRLVRNVVEPFHARVKTTTENLAPRRTGFMATHVETRFSSDRLGAETGWFRDTFMRHSAQTRGRFYPPYPEYGTIHMPARPSLTPAFTQHQQWFIDQAKREMRSARP